MLSHFSFFYHIFILFMLRVSASIRRLFRQHRLESQVLCRVPFIGVDSFQKPLCRQSTLCLRGMILQNLPADLVLRRCAVCPRCPPLAEPLYDRLGKRSVADIASNDRILIFHFVYPICNGMNCMGPVCICPQGTEDADCLSLHRTHKFLHDLFRSALVHPVSQKQNITVQGRRSVF